MFRHIITVVPFWWFIFGTTFLFMILSYTAARISSHYLETIATPEHRIIANNLIGILSGGFSILLAFVIINTWNYRLQTRASVAKEADLLSIMTRDSEIFSQPFSKKLKNAIGRYTVAVRKDEWEKMTEGKTSPYAWISLEALYKEIRAYKPINAQESFYYGQIIGKLDGLLAARRERLNQLESVIPKELRQAIVIGAILLALILGGIRGEDDLLNTMPVLLFSGILGFNLALALSFDYPFSGDISINNQIFYSGILGTFSDESF